MSAEGLEGRLRGVLCCRVFELFEFLRNEIIESVLSVAPMELKSFFNIIATKGGALRRSAIFTSDNLLSYVTEYSKFEIQDLKIKIKIKI